MIAAESTVARRHGKPFDYARLGKTFAQGADFIRYMCDQARRAVESARSHGTLRRRDDCPICGHPAPRPLLNYLGYDYLECCDETCRHAFVADLIDEATRSEFFARDEAYSGRNYCDPQRTEFRLRNIAEPKLRHVEHFIERCGRRPGGHWLDIGCGSGEMLAALVRTGRWQATGLELSQRDAEFGRRELRVDIRNQSLAEFARENPDRLFDVVSLFGVLHCVEQPLELLREAATALRPGGLLVAELTNRDALTADCIAALPSNPSRASFNGLTTLHQFSQQSAQRALETCAVSPAAVWFYGADAHELLNQLCFALPNIAETRLAQRLGELAGELQAALDRREWSSNMLWIARKPETESIGGRP